MRKVLSTTFSTSIFVYNTYDFPTMVMVSTLCEYLIWVSDKRSPCCKAVAFGWKVNQALALSFFPKTCSKNLCCVFHHHLRQRITFLFYFEFIFSPEGKYCCFKAAIEYNYLGINNYVGKANGSSVRMAMFRLKNLFSFIHSFVRLFCL
jgi:hypothetical protein